MFKEFPRLHMWRLRAAFLSATPGPRYCTIWWLLIPRAIWPLIGVDAIMWDYSPPKHRDSGVENQWLRTDEMSRVLTASDSTAAVFQLMTSSEAQHRSIQLSLARHRLARSRVQKSKDRALSFPSCLSVPKGAIGTHRGGNNHLPAALNSLQPFIFSVTAFASQVVFKSTTTHYAEGWGASTWPGMIGKASEEGEWVATASACSLALGPGRHVFIVILNLIALPAWVHNGIPSIHKEHGPMCNELVNSTLVKSNPAISAMHTSEAELICQPCPGCQWGLVTADPQVVPCFPMRHRETG